MDVLRQARFLARLVLAWFVLATGIAMGAPLVQPQSLQLICSGGALKLVATEEGGSAAAAAAGATLDCPLCASVAPPPPARVLRSPPAPAPLLAPRGVAAAAVLAGAPLPARGPPALS